MVSGSLWGAEDHGFICWPKLLINIFNLKICALPCRGEHFAIASCTWGKRIQTPPPSKQSKKKHGTRNTQRPMYEPDVWVQPRVFLTVRCRKSPEYECNCVITLSVCLVMQYLYTHSWAQFTERFYRQWAHLVPTLLKWISNGWYQGWAREKQDDPWTIYCAMKWEGTKNKIKWWR